MEKGLDIKNITENAPTRQDKTRQDKTRQDKTRQVIVLGAIGNTDRQNRDNMRVIARQGLIYTLKAHIDKDHPLVVKKYSDHIKH